MPITIKKVTSADVETLLFFSKKTFLDAFAHLNNPDDSESYTAIAFTAHKLRSELSNVQSEFYFGLLNDELAGYIKLNYAGAQTEFQHNDAVEVERIYVSAHHQRKKIGKQLLDFAINKANKNQLRYIWLGVWEHNHQAIRFYERNGFKQFSSHEFMLGNDLQTDLLMKKELPD